MKLNIDNLDWESIHSLSLSYKKQVLEQLGKVANQRLLRMEQKNLQNYAHWFATQYFDSPKPRVPTRTKHMSEAEVNKMLYYLEDFFKSETKIGEIRERIGKGRVLIQRGKKDVTNEFYYFLQDETYKKMVDMFGSDIVWKFYEQAFEAGVSSDEIFKTFETLLSKSTADIHEAFEELTGKELRV